LAARHPTLAAQKFDEIGDGRIGGHGLCENHVELLDHRVNEFTSAQAF
jgi:hypothetical protein